jgi:hypothetical protein
VGKGHFEIFIGGQEALALAAKAGKTGITPLLHVVDCRDYDDGHILASAHKANPKLASCRLQWNHLAEVNAKWEFPRENEAAKQWDNLITFLEFVPSGSGVLFFCEKGAHRSAGTVLTFIRSCALGPPQKDTTRLDGKLVHIAWWMQDR